MQIFRDIKSIILLCEKNLLIIQMLCAILSLAKKAVIDKDITKSETPAGATAGVSSHFTVVHPVG